MLYFSGILQVACSHQTPASVPRVNVELRSREFRVTPIRLPAGSTNGRGAHQGFEARDEGALIADARADGNRANTERLCKSLEPGRQVDPILLRRDQHASAGAERRLR